MSQPYIRKPPTLSQPYSEAVAECKELMAASSSMKAAAKAANVSEKPLQRPLRKEEGGTVVKVQGQPTSQPTSH